jgi:hypothetical protein
MVKMKNKPQKPLTKSPKQLDIVVLAVQLLGGDRKAVDTEDIAVKSHELAPGIFSWRKYPEQINLELVRVALSDAKKRSYGQLLSGSGREGWRLSPDGIDWIASTGNALVAEGPVQIDRDRLSAGSVDSVRKRREKMRILSSAAWKSWIEQKTISLSDARNLFRIDEYATSKMLDNKIVRLRSQFEDDELIGPFIRRAVELILDTKEAL